MRAFVAVTVPPRPETPGVALARLPEHLTLRFLGDVEAEVTSEVVRTLGPAVEGFSPFEFVLEGLGVFPTVDRPRVVWRRVSRGAGPLQDLARVVGGMVEQAGVPADPTPFVPHVTLFRVRSRRDRNRAAELLVSGDRQGPPPQTVFVTSIQLVESRRDGKGVVHTTLARFPLNGRKA